MRVILSAGTAIALATAVWLVLPHATESAALLYAQDKPALLADLAVSKSLTAETARTEIESALADGDAELAASFVELAHEHGVAVEGSLEARVEAANGAAATAVRAARKLTSGLISGTPDDLAGFAGTAVGDLFVFGDIRDAVREGTHIVRGETADELVFGLACAGLAVTAGTYATIGAGAPARIGLSLVKAARRTGRLAAPVAAWMTRSVREAIDTAALGAALRKVSLLSPGQSIRLVRDAVKVDRAGGIVTAVRDVGRVQHAAGTRAAFEGLKLAEEPEDMARLARLSEAKGSKTRAILKLAGRAAFTLTLAAMDLASWVFTALCAAFGFCAAVKRTAERATERYLRWRKAVRARTAAAVAASAQPQTA